MSEETKQKPYPPRFPIWPLLLVAGFVILIHGAWWLIGDCLTSAPMEQISGIA